METFKTPEYSCVLIAGYCRLLTYVPGYPRVLPGTCPSNTRVPAGTTGYPPSNAQSRELSRPVIGYPRAPNQQIPGCAPVFPRSGTLWYPSTTSTSTMPHSHDDCSFHQNPRLLAACGILSTTENTEMLTVFFWLCTKYRESIRHLLLSRAIELEPEAKVANRMYRHRNATRLSVLRNVCQHFFFLNEMQTLHMQVGRLYLQCLLLKRAVKRSTRVHATAVITGNNQEYRWLAAELRAISGELDNMKPWSI